MLKRETPLDKSVNLIIDFQWLDTIHNDSPFSYLLHEAGENFEQEKCDYLTYDEFRVTKS